MKKLQLVILLLGTLFTNAQVHLQSGAAQISFPLFNYGDAKNNLATSITLQYTAGNGIKVNDLASDVGLGWALGAGGVIQRIQIGEPDDQDSRTAFPINTNCSFQSGYSPLAYSYRNAFLEQSVSSTQNYIDNYYPNGYLYTEFNLNNPFSGNGITSPIENNCSNNCAFPTELCFAPRFKNNENKKWKFSRRALADRAQDIFSFNFNGRAGTFYIGKDGSVLVLPESKIQIQFIETDMSSQGVRTKISEFIITDEQGIRYKFSIRELSEVMKIQEKSFTNVGSYYRSVSSGMPTGKYTVQKWFLSEIVNPRTNVKILFNYSTIPQDVIAGYSVNLNEILGEKDGFSVFEQRAISYSKRISSIITSEGYKFEFSYFGPNVNQVAPTGIPAQALSDIKQYYNSKLIKQVKFDYGYMFKKEIISPLVATYKPENEKRFLRLCLKSIQEVGSDGLSITPPTYFDYYTGSESTNPRVIVPPVHSFAQDFWGYYTLSYTDNDLNNVEIPEYYDLAKIVVFHNINSNIPNRLPTDGMAQLGAIKKITYPNGGSLLYEFEQRIAASGINNNMGNPNRVGGVRVSKVILSENNNQGGNTIQYSYIRENGTSSGWGFEPISCSYTKNIRFYNDQGYNFSGEQSAEYNKTFWSWIVVNVIQTNGFQIAMELLSFASNIISPDPIMMTISIVLKMISAIIEAANYESNKTSYQSNFYPFTSGHTVPIYYSRVVEKNISPGINTGSTVYEYSSPKYFNEVTDDANFAFTPSVFPYAQKMRYAPWKYGLLIKTTTYNQSGQKITQSENTYNEGLMQTLYVNPNYMSVKIDANRTVTGGWANWASTLSNYFDCPVGPNNFSSFLTTEFYYPIKGRVELTQTKAITFAINGTGYNESITTYSYNSNNYLLKESVTQTSNGEIRGEKIYYPSDYSVPGILQTMKSPSVNMINFPVCNVIWKKESASSPKKVISATVTEFGQITNGDIKPIKTYTSELIEPTVSDITEDAGVQNNLFNFSFLKLQNSFFYYNDGNVSSVQGKGLKTGSIIYDYSGQLAIAKIQNAGIDRIAYSSFEADGTGGWSIHPGSTIISNQTALTGTKSFSGLLYKTVPAGNYKLTLWGIYYTSPLVNGAPGTAVKDAGEWRLFEWNLTNISSVTISAPNIDEVRLYPSDAVMVTTAYDPKFGKTAECDANNRIVYYEYDAFGRLLYIRDENKNIIKYYEYKYKN